MSLLNLNDQNLRAALAALAPFQNAAVGSFTADFGNVAATPDVVTVAVTDAAVTAASVIVLGGVAAAAGRDADEAEMEQVDLELGAITAGVGFDVYARSRTATANGAWTGTYVRI